MSIPVPAPAMTAVKALAATVGALATFVGILVTVTSDGVISAADIGTMSAGGTTLVGTVIAVYSLKNKPKNS